MRIRRPPDRHARSAHRPDGKPRRWTILPLALALLLAAAAVAHAAKPGERDRQKQAAEAKRAALREKLSALKRDISRTESARTEAGDALADSEAAISQANRSLRELAGERRETEARLQALSKEHAALNRRIDAQRDRLARLLRDHYVAGNEDRIKLLLSGDNPNRINRDLQYLGYVSKAQAKLLQALRADLQAIEQNKAEAQNAKQELDAIAQQQQDQKKLLEQEKSRRAALLAQLSNKLAAQRKQAGRVERDEQRLSGLVERLAKLIEEQRQAEIAAEKQRRLAAQAAKKARAAQLERQRQLAKTKKHEANRPELMPHNPDAIDADENPAKPLARNELVPEANVQAGAIAASFSALRGRLRLPLKGELIAKYGTRRGDGPNWKGLFIRAPEGSEVKAVAAGRVIFAEWLRGFGNLIIIDHGQQYMTIYGNNQAVLKHAGDPVKAGDVIASAGNSGGNEQSGLYFEMRHDGRPFDPLGWITLR